MKMKGKCTGPKHLSKSNEKAAFGRSRFGNKSGQARRSFGLVMKMFGLCETENGAKIDELLQAGASGHKRVR